MTAHPPATQGLSLSPILLSFHMKPVAPVLFLFVSVRVPSNIVGRRERRYVEVQIRRRRTVKREVKENIADIR
eukprot:CAMPEP_0197548310 /NCGR_PEP_ID=MMETSP1320-20131121/2475_1 /TAXON_ID=91990 /ORGANISM="Bolidomonas sp., Strain RCC2347" /LENGTH=72 /DNA_ID=CAMNT_0043108303 /DNA_START=18 /DNA_END=236 /DNA_ORIENTATION=+